MSRLSQADRADMALLRAEWERTDDPEERAGIRRALAEIMAQTLVTVRSIDMRLAKPDPADDPTPGG